MRNRVSRAQRKSGDAAVVSCAMWRSHLRLVSCVLLIALLRYSSALTIQRLSQRMRLARPTTALRLEPQLRQSQSRILPPTRETATFHLLRLVQSTHTHAQCCRTVHLFPPFCGSFPFRNFACAITPAPTAACRRLLHDSLSAHYLQLITPVADCSMISATTQTPSAIYKHCAADTASE